MGARRAVALPVLILLLIQGAGAFLGPSLSSMGAFRSIRRPETSPVCVAAVPTSDDLAGIGWSPGLLAADILGLKPEIVGRESWAWSHSSRNEGSVVLQLTARIEAEGGKDEASPDLIRARRRMMSLLLQHDYGAYVQAATALGGLIDRADLPNVQDVPYPGPAVGTPKRVQRSVLVGAGVSEEVSEELVPELVPDCVLPNVTSPESLLDKGLLYVFRSLVTMETGFSSPTKGIEGLLEQGTEFKLRPGQTAEAQHKMVYNVLCGLITPVMPVVYYTFMTGIYNGRQIGPWPWAPWLTSFVTPTFFGFLVGPSRANRRIDGSLGGLIVEKCKFLQESGCKGLCRDQCKLPAQQFFADHLGLPLTVSPNFETQECQWSFGEVPKDPAQDPRFPNGCLEGCPTRGSSAASC